MFYLSLVGESLDQLFGAQIPFVTSITTTTSGSGSSGLRLTLASPMPNPFRPVDASAIGPTLSKRFGLRVTGDRRSIATRVVV